jgi:CheY-like chemotaxis protein
MSTESTDKIILLADDDMDDAEIFGHILEDIDPSLKFYHVTNGSGVMHHLGTPENPKPDIIFLDLNMPEMNGWQCLSRLKSEDKTRDIPVLIYSTSSYLRDKQQAMASGASAFITKPSDYKTLQRLLFKISTSLRRDLMSTIHKLCP